jgi:hypothetical protein
MSADNVLLNMGTVGYWPQPKSAEQLEKERALAEMYAQFPVDGMWGKIKTEGIEVWRAGNDDPQYETLSFGVNQCHFCDEAKPTLHISDDWMEMYVCRDCLDKMFGVLEAEVNK